VLEGMMVAGQILISLRGSDRIEQFLPYIEKVAQPGTKIIFLVHYGLTAFKELTDQVFSVCAGITTRAGNGDEEQLKRRTRSAEVAILPACVALREKGMEITVSVFAGPLHKVVRGYSQKEDIDLIMMHPGAGNWVVRSLRKIGSLSHFFRPQALPPVLVFHPSSIIGRFR
jgi:hypothetical protein